MGILATLFFTLVSIVFVAPIFIVLINSMKSKTFINLETFKLPTEESYVGLENYKTAITQYDFLKAVGWTLFITVFSVAVILICCSMTAWFITRVKNVFTKMIYLLCVFSMVIPFQMVMFTLSGTADSLHLNTPWGIVIVYLGFGAGLAVFMFTGFVKSIPVEVEEEEPEEQQIFQVVEEMPEFPGGMAECLKFLGKNIKYPTISQENGVQGKVIVQFVVNKDGSIVDPVVVRSVDPYLDKEALRVIKTMPKWKPGKQRGKAVRVKYTVPVTFKLQ